MSERERSAPGATLPPGYRRVWCLLVLQEAPTYGYELLRQLRASTGVEVTGGAFYRMLRAMEVEGVLESQWEVAAPRRMYSITATGRQSLQAHTAVLRESLGLVDAFLLRHERLGRRRTAAA